MNPRRLLLLAALLVTHFATAGQVLNFTGHTGSFTDGVDRVLGWDFTTGSTPVSVTALSFFDEGQNGLAVAHPVALYKTSTQQQVATATIPAGTAAPLVGFFRTVAITPVPLEANTTYTLAGSWPAGSDPWVWNGGVAGIDLTGVSTDPNTTTGTSPARFLDTTATLQFPTQQIGDNRKWFVGPNVTVSAAGELDLTFNGTGKVVTDVGGGQDYGISVVVQADGKIVVAGNAFVGSASRFALARFNPDGSIDPSFNGTGRVITSIGTYESGTSVAIQPDGKIVVAGNSRTGTNPFDFAVVRYNGDGTLDTTFSGTGKVTTPIGSGNDGARAVVIRNDQKILVCGFAQNPVDNDFAVARYQIDGSLDPSFNGLGKVTTDVGGGSDMAAAAALQGDGKVVVAGYASIGGVNRVALVRYKTDGTLDGDLNGLGKLTTEIGGVDARGNGVAIDYDGKIIVAGSSNSGSDDDFALLRYNPNGSLDSVFNGSGVVTTDISSGSSDIAHSVAVQTDGKIVVAGESNTRFTVVRYEANGSLDSSFGAGGKVTTTFGASDYGNGVALQSDRKIVVAGFTVTGAVIDFALARYVAGPDSATLSPTLSTVGSAQYQGRTMSVDFSLPEAAQSGSVKLTFDNGMTQTTFTLGPAFETQGAHSLTFDPDAPNASGHFTSATALADGTYTVTLAYQDALGNPAATSAGVMNVGVSSVLPPGALDPAFDPNVTGMFVTAAAVQPDGKTIFGGTFTMIAGAAQANLVRLEADGSVDGGLTASTNGNVYGAAVLADGKILIVGDFTQVNGATRTHIARLNADGSLDASFNTSVPENATVACMAVQADGQIVIGGFFSQVNGVARSNIARLNADGTLDASFDPGSGTDGFVYGVAMQADGKIVLAGDFATVGGATHTRIARLDANGSVDANFNASADGVVITTAVQRDGQILIGGNFTSVSGELGHHGIARLNPDGSIEDRSTFDPGLFPIGIVISIAVQADGKIVLGGNFTSINNQPRNRIARLEANGQLESSATFDIGAGADGQVQCVALQADGQILLGGLFSSFNGTTRNHIARLANDPPAQSLSAPDATQVQWQRSGTVPEASSVAFEFSVNGGATWSSLGTGTRVAGGWKLTGINLNGFRGSLRALARTTAGYGNGSGGLVAQTGAFDFDTVGGFTVAPTLAAPASNLATKSPITVTFTLPEPALAGSVKLRFERASGGLLRTLTLAPALEGAGEHTFTFDPANPTASSAVVSIAPAGTNIVDVPDYNVTLSYQDTLGNPAASAVNTNVKIDTVTQAPAQLSFPQTDGTLGGAVSGANPFSSLLINLPEAPLPGSVIFTFDDGTTQYVLTTTNSVNASGQTQIVLNTANVVAGSFVNFPAAGQPAACASMTNGPAIPQGGPYSVSFTYQDAVGNTAVQSNIATGVFVDLVTQAPTLTLPTTSAFIRNSAMVNFTLPEAAFDSPGVVTLSFGATTLVLDQSLHTAGNHSFTFDPSDPVGTSGGAIVSGNALADGTYTVTLSYRDAVLNPAATATATNVRIDRVPPTFSPNFSPTIVYAGTVLANYESQTGASDPNGLFVGGLGSQSPAPGTVLTAGTQRVTFNVADNAGNSASTFFDLIVRPVDALSEVRFAKDGAAPGRGTNGLPADAELVSFGMPAIDNDGALAFTAKWTSDTSGKGSGLFTDTACLAIVGGDASALTGVATAKWKSFSDPVIHSGRVACLATLSGVAVSSASVVLSFAANGAPTLVARAGAAATADGAKFKAFKGVAVANDALALFAQLAAGTGAPRTTAASDLGLWLQDGANLLTLVLREGDPSGDTKIRTLTSFAAGNGSPGHGRGWVVTPGGGNPRAYALATMDDKSQAIFTAFIGAFGDVANTDGGDFSSLGLPAVNSNSHVAFLGSLPLGGTVTKENARAIFADLTGGGTFTQIARVGEPAGATGANFSVLKDAVLAEDDGLAFPATIKGGTVRGAAMKTLWWQPSGGAPTLLAQGGAQPPDLPAGAQWKAFPSLAIAANRGPIFSATLVPGKGGVTAKNASGVWACDFLGAPRLLFRTGDTNIVANKTLKSFTLLKATKGSAGVTRSFNGAQQVVWLAAFTDKSQAIVATEVP